MNLHSSASYKRLALDVIRAISQTRTMKFWHRNKQSKSHQFATFALLVGLFLSQCFLAAHSADVGAHDNELCEICLGFNSPNKPLALGADIAAVIIPAAEKFESRCDSLYRPSLNVSHQAIRAPPVTEIS